MGRRASKRWGPFVVGLLCVAASSLLVGSETGRWFEFERLNRSYPDAVGAFEPVVSGPLSVTMSSPQNVVTVHRHRARLTPRVDGTFDTVLDVEVGGGGVVETDVAVAGLGTRIVDRFDAPRQRLQIPGRARVERGIGGLEITPLELPTHVVVAIQSTLGARLVGWCERSTVWLPGAADCTALDESMGTVSVDLPEPGDTYFLPRGEIGEEEWVAIVTFLEQYGSERASGR